MGRKDYRQAAQRGPGPKARRQKDPKLPPELLPPAPADGDEKKLSSRQKKRQKKRLERLVPKKDAPSKSTPSPAVAKAANDADDADEGAEDADMLSESSSDAGADESKLRLDLEEEGEGAEDGEGGVGNGRLLLEDDDDEYLNDDFDPEDASSDDDDEEKKGDAEMAEEGKKATAEAEEAAATKEPLGEAADLSELDGQIDQLLQALGSKGGAKQLGMTRCDCVDKLCELLCKRFNYNAFLMRKLIDLYPKDILDFLQSNEVDRPLTLRANALKTRRKDLAQSLINRGVNLDPFDKWSKVGLVVYDSQVPLGATPEYLAGHYMLQGAASMLPVLALGPKPGEKLLDLCAAPGGKTTYAGELMRNTGLIMANEANRERAKAIVGNAHRHGLNNIVVCVGDGREFIRTMHNFDRVLVDAPCTGTGVIAKDPAVKVNKEEKDVLKCSHLQKQLLLAGIDALKVGGSMVYCTCSVLVEENESVVDYGLKRRSVKLVDTELPIGEAGFRAFKEKKFHPSMTLTKRITPHQHNMDGFFVSKLVKLASAKPSQQQQQQQKQQKRKQQQGEDEDEEEEEEDDEEEEAAEAET